MPDALNYRVPDTQIYRVGPQQGGPPMCLMCWTTEKDLRQGSPLSAWRGGATEKDWPKRPSDRQLQEAQKKTDRAITSVAEAVCVLGHLALPGSPQAKKLHHLHAQLSLGQSCHRQKKKSCINIHRVGSVMSNTLQPCRLWPARLHCQGVLQARILKHMGQYWLPHPSRELYFLLP